jgi:hypothetical protein
LRGGLFGRDLIHFVPLHPATLAGDVQIFAARTLPHQLTERAANPHGC